MASTMTILRGAFLDLAEVSLGCLVPDVLNPGQDYWPEKPDSVPNNEISKRSFSNIHELLSRDKHAGLRSKLTSIFRSDITSQNGSALELIAPQSTVYFIKHPKSHFKRLCQDKTTKEWIEETLRDSHIFLLVGFVTVTQAQVDRDQHKSKELHVAAEVPVTAIMTSGVGAIFPGGNTSDVGVSISGGTTETSATSFLAPGERVIGIQYRKLHFELFSSSKVDTASLKPNQWVMFFGGDRSGSNDALEADLEDSVDADELELMEDDYDALFGEEYVQIDDID